MEAVAAKPETTGKFTWTITNFSSLNTRKQYSEIFHVGGCKWRMLIFPNGNKVDHLSVYLDVADSVSLPYGWSRSAQFSLTVINHLNSANNFTKATQHQFNVRQSDWGFTSLMPLKELYDLSRGYLVDDTFVVEAEVTVCGVVDSHIMEAPVITQLENCPIEPEEAAMEVPTAVQPEILPVEQPEVPLEAMPEVRTTTFLEAPVEVSLGAHSGALLEALPEVATSEGVAGVVDQVPHAAVKSENLCSKAPPAVPGTSTARELLGFGWPTGTRRRTRPLDAEANFFFNLVREVLAAGASVALDDIRGQLEDITGSYFLAGLPKPPWMDFIRHVWSFVVCRWHLEEARLKHRAELVTQLANLEEGAAGEEEKAQQAAEAVRLHQCSYDEAAAAATDLESRIEVLKIDLGKVHSQMETHRSEVFHQERCREEHVCRATRMRATMNLLCQQMEAPPEGLPSVDEVMERNPLNQAPPPLTS